MEKLKDINGIKHKLIDWVKKETDEGFKSPEEVEILGEVVDMIKDLASAEESCMEAAYYENVTEAMENYEEGDGKAGYDRWRYSSGRFAPKGRGTYGYVPPYMMNTVDPMGYTRTDGRTNGGNGRMTDGRMNNGRSMAMGYTDDAMMHGKPSERLDAVVDAMGDIWTEADPETKKRMRMVVDDLREQMERA